MQDLLERIQASEEEIITNLNTINACQIDGNLTWVFMNDPLDTYSTISDYIFSVLKAIGGYWILTMRWRCSVTWLSWLILNRGLLIKFPSKPVWKS